MSHQAKHLAPMSLLLTSILDNGILINRKNSPLGGITDIFRPFILIDQYEISILIDQYEISILIDQYEISILIDQYEISSFSFFKVSEDMTNYKYKIPHIYGQTFNYPLLTEIPIGEHIHIVTHQQDTSPGLNNTLKILGVIKLVLCTNEQPPTCTNTHTHTYTHTEKTTTYISHYFLKSANLANE